MVYECVTILMVWLSMAGVLAKQLCHSRSLSVAEASHLACFSQFLPLPQTIRLLFNLITKTYKLSCFMVLENSRVDISRVRASCQRVENHCPNSYEPIAQKLDLNKSLTLKLRKI